MKLINKYLKSEKGYALMFVLVFMLLLSVLSMIAYTISSSNSRMKSMQNRAIKGFYIADGALDISKELIRHSIKAYYQEQEQVSQSNLLEDHSEALKERISSDLTNALVELVNSGDIPLDMDASLSVDVGNFEQDEHGKVNLSISSIYMNAKVKRSLAENYEITIIQDFINNNQVEVSIKRSNWRILY